MKVLLIILLFLNIIITSSCNNRNSNVTKSREFHGFVESKHIDKMNHYENTIVLNDGTSQGIFGWEQANRSLFKNIKIGDSISKNKGEYSLFVYKKDGRVKEYKYTDRKGKVYNNKEGL